MRILEIFSSIQGEGHYIGVPAIFIRTMGCNLRCDFCDTKQSWSAGKPVTGITHGTELSVMDILVITRKERDFKLVVITGGEPCIQPELFALIAALHAEGKEVAVETNGTQATPHNLDWVTCSPKADANYVIHNDCLADELKYVVTLDFDPTVITEAIRNRFVGNIWLQPDGYNMQEAWKKCYVIAQSDSRLRVGLQLQKLMEVK